VCSHDRTSNLSAPRRRTPFTTPHEKTEEVMTRDAELVQCVRAGSVAAFGELYERHFETATRLARRLSRCPADADDLVAEAFTKLVEVLLAGRGPGENFRAYLFTTLRHLAYDHVVHNSRVVCVAEFSDRATEPVDVPDEHETALVRRALATLPPRWRTALWQTEVARRSCTELAAALGITPNAAAALACRARRGLKRAYLSARAR
jgi:RNA polymerase sigma factor (sigma-70 family)